MVHRWYDGILGGELLRLSRPCPPSLCHALRISRINGRSNGSPSDAQKPIHAILVLLPLSWSAQSCLHISIRAFADDMFSRSLEKFSLECAIGSDDDDSLFSSHGHQVINCPPFKSSNFNLVLVHHHSRTFRKPSSFHLIIACDVIAVICCLHDNQ